MKKIILLISIFFYSHLSVFSQYGWNGVGIGTNFTVQSLATDTNNNILYAGGLFNLAGGITAPNVAKWNGSSYAPLGAGVVSGTGVYSLLVMPNGDLIAGGTFSNIGGVLVKNIAKWNGITWAPLGLGLDTSSSVVIKALAIYNNDLYAGGIFNTSGGSPVNFISRWDGANWQPVGTGTNGKVLSLCVYNNELYAGGVFTNAGGVAVKNIAKWNGTTWSDVGGGCTDYTGAISVSALQVYGGDLYAGGHFDTAGVTPVNNIAKWSGSSWSDVGGGTVNYTGAISVSAFQVFNGDLVTGGTFDTLGTTPSRNIGKWNGISWSNMGTGMNNSVYALGAMKDTLYAGGLFTMAGSVNTPFIAEWKPTIVSAMYEESHATGADKFILYPNPATENVRIIYKGGNPGGAYNFILTDALGRQITKLESKDAELSLERKNISPGMYFYKITGKDNALLQEGKIMFAGQ